MGTSNLPFDAAVGAMARLRRRFSADIQNPGWSNSYLSPWAINCSESPVTFTGANAKFYNRFIGLEVQLIAKSIQHCSRYENKSTISLGSQQRDRGPARSGSVLKIHILAFTNEAPLTQKSLKPLSIFRNPDEVKKLKTMNLASTSITSHLKIHDIPLDNVSCSRRVVRTSRERSGDWWMTCLIYVSLYI